MGSAGLLLNYPGMRYAPDDQGLLAKVAAYYDGSYHVSTLGQFTMGPHDASRKRMVPMQKTKTIYEAVAQMM